MKSIRKFPLELQLAVEAARADGFYSEASQGFLMLSWFIYKANDAEQTSHRLLAAESSPVPDDATRCHQLANTARCLMELEFDVSRAFSLADESSKLAEVLGIGFTELEWAHALIARWNGESEPAHAHMESALAHALAKADHWREYQCLMWLATVAYEIGRLEDVPRHCAQLDRVAGLMGDTRAPAADALHALADIRLGHESSEAALNRALAGLREIDDKAALAYTLNQSALFHLDRAEFESAASLAGEALTAARALRRSTEVAVATAALACAAAGLSDRRRAAAHLARFTAQCGPLSARARFHLDQAAKLTGLTIPTIAPTA
jgi:hypothetical protein